MTRVGLQRHKKKMFSHAGSIWLQNILSTISLLIPLGEGMEFVACVESYAINGQSWCYVT